MKITASEPFVSPPVFGLPMGDIASVPAGTVHKREIFCPKVTTLNVQNSNPKPEINNPNFGWLSSTLQLSENSVIGKGDMSLCAYDVQGQKGVFAFTPRFRPGAIDSISTSVKRFRLVTALNIDGRVWRIVRQWKDGESRDSLDTRVPLTKTVEWARFFNGYPDRLRSWNGEDSTKGQVFQTVGSCVDFVRRLHRGTVEAIVDYAQREKLFIMPKYEQLLFDTDTLRTSLVTVPECELFPYDYEIPVPEAVQRTWLLNLAYGEGGLAAFETSKTEGALNGVCLTNKQAGSMYYPGNMDNWETAYPRVGSLLIMKFSCSIIASAVLSLAFAAALPAGLAPSFDKGQDTHIKEKRGLCPRFLPGSRLSIEKSQPKVQINNNAFGWLKQPMKLKRNRAITLADSSVCAYNVKGQKDVYALTPRNAKKPDPGIGWETFVNNFQLVAELNIEGRVWKIVRTPDEEEPASAMLQPLDDVDKWSKFFAIYQNRLGSHDPDGTAKAVKECADLVQTVHTKVRDAMVAKAQKHKLVAEPNYFNNVLFNSLDLTASFLTIPEASMATWASGSVDDNTKMAWLKDLQQGKGSLTAFPTDVLGVTQGGVCMTSEGAKAVEYTGKMDNTLPASEL
ncbi:hypothetical protein FRB99_005776 [Tulasnella sp. 403]|nr:hypothetical protein FRB99_005776 [Tulasnella sp. 403]